jgi:hypothetical protein
VKKRLKKEGIQIKVKKRKHLLARKGFFKKQGK